MSRPETFRVNVEPGACPSPHGLANKAGRVAWGLVWGVLFRCSPRPLDAWRRLLLRLFGARIGRGARILPSARIWAPWNLEMGDYACLSDRVDCYCVALVSIGAHATVSQYSYLCAATHDLADPHMRLVARPIVIEDQAWVAADVFVGPGVRIGQGCVVGARSSVFRDLPAWTVCRGTPAKPFRDRVVHETADNGTDRLA